LGGIREEGGDGEESVERVRKFILAYPYSNNNDNQLVNLTKDQMKPRSDGVGDGVENKHKLT
jgi:hypothetical protein